RGRYHRTLPDRRNAAAADARLRLAADLEHAMTGSYRAMQCEELGPPERLRPALLPRPALRPHQFRIRIRAAGVNYPDLLQVTGRYQHKPQLPFVPGLEAAGEIVEAGSPVA